ncbi:MAG: GAF domain-containing protein, partial [Nitrospira sp.]|nr:GAF domain-containing protein [Nitrospira sp.]
MNTLEAHARQETASQPTARFFSLRMKFVAFFSLILIVACSSLSWYFIETRHTAMTDNLQELGTILLANTVLNDHFRIAGVVLEDRTTLDQFIESLLAVEHVVYVVITASDGRILDRHSKRIRQSSNHAPHSSEELIYPQDHLSESLLRTPLTTPVITKFVLSAEDALVPPTMPDWLLPASIWQETLYDFSMPVLRASPTAAALSQHAVELGDPLNPVSLGHASTVVGLVRIGISDIQAKQALRIIIRNMLIFTLLIIAAAILGAHLLTSRITIPLRRLAAAAQQLAAGNEAPSSPIPITHDEVGQLTQLFNLMTQSLYDRNKAIRMNIETISRQIRQLTTVHQASIAIASTSTLNMEQLLDAVLHLLTTNLGFSRMAVLLNHAECRQASVAQIIGVSPEIADAARRLDMPVIENGGIMADLLIYGKPLLILDIETFASRIYPPTLELMRRSGVQSFVAVPLQSHGKIVGILTGDRGAQPCTEEDLHILQTIAGHVAASLDNAMAYHELAELTRTLEQRIAQRTHELSVANEHLHTQDQRRSKYVKIVSHELRTPMTAIRSFAENMLDGIGGPLTELQRTYLARTKHSVARLVRLAD